MFPAAKWAPPAFARSAASPSPAAAVELELARAAALEQLRSKFASLCAKAGLRNAPLLSLERWRFAAKWAEEEPHLAALAAQAGSGSSGKQASAAATAPSGKGDGKGGKQGKPAGGGAADPVLPYGGLAPAPEPGLVADLARSGLSDAAATGVAQQLAEASREACARLAKRRHQLVSGKPPSCPPLQLAFRRHSLELTCGGRFVRVRTAGFARGGGLRGLRSLRATAQGLGLPAASSACARGANCRCLVLSGIQVSRGFYGKLARMYRAHWLEAPGAAGGAADCTIGLPMEAAAARLAGLEAAGQPAAGSSHSTAGGAGQQAGGSGESSDEGSDDEAPGGQPAAGGTAGSTAALSAEAALAELEAAAAGADGGSGNGDGCGPRSEFHQRLFALLLRYKSIQGAGFQARPPACTPAASCLLRCSSARMHGW